MIVEEPNAPRAERFTTLVDLGLAAWAKRWGLYVAIAAVSVGIEFAAAILARYDALTALIVASCIDGFATAFVSIDVAARFSGTERSANDVARAALARWPVVGLLLVLVSFLEAMIVPSIFGSVEDTFYGALILPALVAFGVFGIAPVVASIDTSLPVPALPLYSLYRSIVCARAWPNLGRLTIAGAMVAVPLMLQELLQQWMTARGFAAGPASFWGSVPVDALCVAPFQAFFTYLYLDFTVREQRR